VASAAKATATRGVSTLQVWSVLRLPGVPKFKRLSAVQEYRNDIVTGNGARDRELNPLAFGRFER
jgi:hypothetical protein